MRKAQAGVTLLEVTIAITLLSLLSLGMVMSLRVGLAAFLKTDSKLMDIRRVVGAQHVIRQELSGMIPVLVTCGDRNAITGFKAAFFQGEASSMRLVSSFSLEGGWRGQPQVLELTVLSGGEGVKLVVNEVRYMGYPATGAFCTGVKDDLPQFIGVNAREGAFVLADQLAYCRFSYYGPSKQANQPPGWTPQWRSKNWPQGIRIEMAPAEVDPSRVHPVTVTVPIHIRRDPEKKYDDVN